MRLLGRAGGRDREAARAAREWSLTPRAWPPEVLSLTVQYGKLGIYQGCSVDVLDRQTIVDIVRESDGGALLCVKQLKSAVETCQR